MAGDWIKIEHALCDKPEVFQIADKLAIDPYAVVGRLVRFWCWADQNSEDGDEMRITKSALDRLTHQPGFTDALIEVGWLDDTGNSFAIPGFAVHNGVTAKRRTATNRAVADYRERERDNPAKQIFPRGLKRHVKERDGYCCVYCGRKEGEYSPLGETKRDGYMCLDHVFPESRGGPTVASNLVCACMKCNMVKANRTPEEAGMTFKRIPSEIDLKYARITPVLQNVLPEKRREEKSREEVSEKIDSLPGVGSDAPTLDLALECDPAPEAKPTKRIKPSETALEAAFNEFWQLYPPMRREGKGGARIAYAKACSKASPESINAAAAEYRKCIDSWKAEDQKYVPMPSRWLNDERFSDGGDAIRARMVSRDSYDDSGATH